MKNRLFALVSVGLSLCGTAMAQYSGGVNVDFNAVAGAGAGQPTILFGGAAGQGGYWNPVNPPYISGTSVTLRNLANSADAVTMMYSWGGAVDRAAFSYNHPETSGDTELLLDDCFDAPLLVPHIFTVGPFAPGLYRVVTYAVTPDSASSRTDIEVSSNQAGPIMTFSGTQTVGGPIGVGGALALGVTHSQHTVPMYANGSIIIRATASVGFGAVNGFQIQRLAPTRLYVRPGAEVLGTGLSWDEPFDRLQVALAFARNTPSVTEIWVAGGTYYADEFPETANDRNAEFLLRSNLTIYGGFTGTESGLSQRNPANPPTILSGRNLAYHTVVADGATNCVLDGVTITGGSNDLNFIDVGYFSGGAGVFAENNASLTLRGCTVRNNSAPNGGGSVLAYQSTLLMEDCTVRDNAAVTGTGLSLFGSAGTVRRCAFTNNAGIGSGGLFSVNNWYGVSTLDCRDSLLANNTVELNLVDASVSTNFTLVNCTVANNRSTGTHVRIVVPAGAHAIRNCIFWGNQNIDGIVGAASIVSNADFVNRVSDCIIQGWDNSLGPASNLNLGNDPRFIAPVAAGISASIIPITAYQLDSRSPARDSGWNGSTSSTNDLLGRPRLFDDPFFPNTGFANGTIDRGCYEMQNASVICPGDLGSQGGVPGPDGLRDNNDFVVFIDLFFTPDPRADLGSQGGVPGGDGLYDNNDFVVFIDLFFTACP